MDEDDIIPLPEGFTRIGRTHLKCTSCPESHAVISVGQREDGQTTLWVQVEQLEGVFAFPILPSGLRELSEMLAAAAPPTH